MINNAPNRKNIFTGGEYDGKTLQTESFQISDAFLKRHRRRMIKLEISKLANRFSD